jgi:uncharacterized protein involved in exopolysaccharide biosynthesis
MTLPGRDAGIAADERAHPGGGDATGLLRAANMLIRNRRPLILLPLVTGGVAAALALASPRSYEAAASFVPNGAGEGASAQIGSIAAQLGMSLVTSQPGQSPAFYGELLQTRGILHDAVQTRYRVRDGSRVVTGNLVHFYGLDDPDTAPAAGPSPAEAAIEALKRSVSTSVSPETGVVQVKVVAEQPALAEAIAGRLIALTEDFDQNKRRTQASARRVFSEARLNESRAELRAAEGRLQGFVSHNRMFSQSALQMLEYNRLQQELLLRQQVYAALAQAYEQARIDEVKNTPVITVLESPQGAARPLSRGVVPQTGFGVLLGLAIAISLALVREKARLAASTRSPELDEFVRLRAQVPRPLRWLVPRGRVAPETGNGRPAAGVP